MTQDLYYYEAGYIDESYFVYTADAEALVTAESTMTATVGVIKSAASALTAEFTQTVTISHIEGADLFAMSNASLAAEVSRIRDYNIEVTSAFTQVVSGAKFIYVGSDQTAEFNITADNQRVRFNQAAIDAAFSLAADAEVIIGGDVLEAQADILANSYISTSASVTRNITSSLESTNSISLTAEKIRNAIVELTAAASITSTVGITKQVTVAAGALFTPSVDCVVTVNSFAVLESQSTIEINNSRTRNLTAEATVTSALSAVVNVITDTNSDIDSAFVQTTQIQQLAGLNTSIDSSFTQTSNANRIKQFVIAESSLFSPIVSCNAVRNSFAVLESTTSVIAEFVQIKQVSSAVNTSFSLSVVASGTSGSVIACTTTTTLSAVAIRAIRFIDSAVQGQILTTSGEVEQEEIFPNWARLMLFTPIVVEEGGVELADGKFNNGLKFISRGSAHSLSHGPVYGSAGYLALRLDQNARDTGIYLHTSTDGESWSDLSHNLDIPFAYIKKITYVNGQYFVLGNGGGYLYISRSTDMSNWTNWSDNSISSGSLADITYANNLYLIIINEGANSYISSSTNLTTWTVRHTRTRPATDWTVSYTEFATTGTTTVVVGHGYDGSPGVFVPYFAYSTNGTTWTTGIIGANGGSGAVNKRPYSVSRASNYWTMVGSLGMIYTSTDMSTWTAGTSNTTATLYSVKSVLTGSTTVIYGQLGSGEKVILSTENSSTWNNAVLTQIQTDDLLYRSNGPSQYAQVSYANSKWIAGDYVSDDNGTTWTVLDYQLPNKQPFIKYDYVSDWNTWKTLDFWTYIPEHPYQFAEFGLASKRGATNATAWSFFIEAQASGSLALRMAWNGSIRYAFTITSSFVYSEWNHIRVVSNGTTGAVYLNGTRLGTITPPTTWATGEDTLNIGLSSWVAENQYARTVDYYLDEVMISQDAMNDPALSSITVPTAPWQNNDYTSILLHYDTNFEDDPNTPLRNAEADIASEFTQTAVSVISAVATVNMLVNAGLSASGILIKEVTAGLNTAFSLTATALDLDLAVVTISATTSLTAQAGVIKQGAVATSSNATVTADNLRIRYATADLTAFDTLVVVSGRIQIETAQMEVTAIMAVTAKKIAQGSSAISTAFTQAVQAKKLNGARAEFVTASSISIVFDKVIDFVATESTVSTMAVTAVKTVSAESDVTLITVLSASTSNEVRVTGSLFGAAAVACQVKVTKGAGANLQATASLLAITNNVVRASANLNVGAFELVNGKVINLGDSPTWTVPQETTTWVITRESTEWIIPFEQRTYKF